MEVRNIYPTVLGLQPMYAFGTAQLARARQQKSIPFLHRGTQGVRHPPFGRSKPDVPTKTAESSTPSMQRISPMLR
jgi:hypothetical protein